MKTLIRVALLCLPLCISSCAPSTSAVMQSIQFAARKDLAPNTATLNPNFRYLRATVDGRVALLVLGYVENHPDGPVQVWYSAEREVLRLQNGRVVGAVGLTHEWRKVTLAGAPRWSVLKDSRTSYQFTRIRDVMPGYRYGVRDKLSIHSIQAPGKSSLQNLPPEKLAWFEESFDDGNVDSSARDESSLPPARYALAFQDSADGEVVYGEQCLSNELCFTWQQWPPKPQRDNASR